MNRRTILGGIPFLPFLDFKNMLNQRKSTSVKPVRLHDGDTIALVAPSGPVPEKTIEKALQTLQKLGYKVKMGDFVRERNGYFAGTDAQRAADLNAAFADKNVNAVWCLRGGYGATRVLPLLDFEVIKKNPKIFIGYSDITAFHTAFSQKTGLVCFHGPVGSLEYSDFTGNHVWNVLKNPTPQYLLQNATENLENTNNLYKIKTIRSGKARGKLIGGNLTLLAAMAGTPFALKNLKGKILFIEDIEEQPYRIDAMLTQLMRNLDLNQCAGLALGIFAGCNPKGNDFSSTLMECLEDKFKNLTIPIVYGLSFGHISHQFTLPVGIEATLDADKATLTLEETAVL